METIWASHPYSTYSMLDAGLEYQFISTIIKELEIWKHMYCKNDWKYCTSYFRNQRMEKKVIIDQEGSHIYKQNLFKSGQPF